MTNLWYDGVAIFQGKQNFTQEPSESCPTHSSCGATVGFALSDEYIQQGIESRFTSNIPYISSILVIISQTLQILEKNKKTENIQFWGPVQYQTRDGCCLPWSPHWINISTCRWVVLRCGEALSDAWRRRDSWVVSSIRDVQRLRFHTNMYRHTIHYMTLYHMLTYGTSYIYIYIHIL